MQILKNIKARRYIYLDEKGLLLLLGYILIPASYCLPYLTLGQVGAILVGVSIVAEVFHRRTVYANELYIREIMGETYRYLVYNEVKDSKGTIRWEKSIKRSLRRFDPMDAFPELCGEKEPSTPYYIISHVKPGLDGLKEWRPSEILDKVSNHFDWAISITTCIGTLLWAFL